MFQVTIAGEGFGFKLVVPGGTALEAVGNAWKRFAGEASVSGKLASVTDVRCKSLTMSADIKPVTPRKKRESKPETRGGRSK